MWLWIRIISNHNILHAMNLKWLNENYKYRTIQHQVNVISNHTKAKQNALCDWLSITIFVIESHIYYKHGQMYIPNHVWYISLFLLIQLMDTISIKFLAKQGLSTLKTWKILILYFRWITNGLIMYNKLQKKRALIKKNI